MRISLNPFFPFIRVSVTIQMNAIEQYLFQLLGVVFYVVCSNFLICG